MVASDAHAEASAPTRPPLPARVKDWVRGHRGGAIAIVAGVVVLIVAVFLLRAYLASRVTTDDAVVDGHIAEINARVAGTVRAVFVEENQAVKKGQAILELDPRDYQVAVARAQAELAQTQANLAAEDPRTAITRVTQETQVATAAEDTAAARAQVAGAERDLASAQARVKQADATANRARLDAQRADRLIKEEAISPAEHDQRVADDRAAEAALDSARELARSAAKVVDQQKTRLDATVAKQQQVTANAPGEVSAQRASLAARQAAVLAAQAALERAKLDLEYTRVVAPFDGIVGRRAAEVGQHVSPDEPLFAVVDVNDLWVTANFKETQLEDIGPGLRATVTVDAFGDSFRGQVESIGAASGARFSLLPPENATGNYVKVVQRVPVRIRLDPGQPGLDRLRPGMSVEPKVWLR